MKGKSKLIIFAIKVMEYLKKCIVTNLRNLKIITNIILTALIVLNIIQRRYLKIRELCWILQILLEYTRLLGAIGILAATGNTYTRISVHHSRSLISPGT